MILIFTTFTIHIKIILSYNFLDLEYFYSILWVSEHSGDELLTQTYI